MADRTQFGWPGRFFAVGAGVERARVPLALPLPPSVQPGSPWPGSPENNRGKDRRPSGRDWIGGRWVQVAYALIDVVCVVASGAFAFALRFSPGGLPTLSRMSSWSETTGQPMARYGAILLLNVALILLFCHSQDLYRTPRTRSIEEESLAVIKALSYSTLVLVAFIFLSGASIVSRLVVATSFPINVVLLVAWRMAKRRLVTHRAERGIGTRNAVIVGAGRVGQALARELEDNKLLGYRFKGFLDANHSDEPRMLGRIEDLARVARSEYLDDVFITIPSERELVKRIAAEAQQQHLDVKVIPELFDGMGWRAPIRQVGEFPVMDLHWQPIPSFGLLWKRIVDVAGASLALVVCAPLLAALAAWIRIESPGSAIYGSIRVGRKGRTFRCYKLRTMVQNADALKDSLRDRNERHGPIFKIARDPRITPLGRFLRRYSLDELPQFWNVLKGEMSLVGPRPHPLDDYKRYDLDHRRRLEVKPGLTGLWQVTARRDPSFETNMHLDLKYIDTWNLGLDAEILLRTFSEVWKGTGN
ncbi:MAG: sugar transferase [Candidatus Acidiferrales bacterium]